MNLIDAVEAFILAKRADGRAPRTIKDYHRCLDPFAEWCARRDKTTDTLTRSDFRAYVVKLRDENDWAESTVAIHVRVLRCFLRWIYEEGYVEKNLATAVDAPPKIIRSEEPLTIEEVEQLLAACHGEFGKRDRAVILVFLDTGMRRSEIATLERDQVHINKRNAWIKVWDTKSSQWKFVFLGRLATHALAQYLENRDDDNPALWMGQRGPLTPDGIYQIVKRRADAAGVEVHPHLFRKTFATWWIRSGGDTQRLKKLGGWKTDEMLEVYVLLAARRDLEEAHQQFGPVDCLLDARSDN
jgi:site-specific recombinase XerD